MPLRVLSPYFFLQKKPLSPFSLLQIKSLSPYFFFRQSPGPLLFLQKKSWSPYFFFRRRPGPLTFSSERVIFFYFFQMFLKDPCPCFNLAKISFNHLAPSLSKPPPVPMNLTFCCPYLHTFAIQYLRLLPRKAKRKLIFNL